jgi:hypothetical protein
MSHQIKNMDPQGLFLPGMPDSTVRGQSARSGRGAWLARLTLVLVATAWINPPGSTAGGGLLWPLAGTPAVSSNFCEYREGHFHAGLDIRTFGAEGVACIAVGDGYVSRLRASPEGYGRVLYIRLDSGETVVYAHLAEFTPELETALYNAQRRAFSFVVDVRFPRARYPVRRGDVIGYSGSTGGVPPHLHFEIRDEGEHPVNPFSHGFALEDRLPPEFTRLQFVPLSARARIDGRCWPVEFSTTLANDGTYTVSDTLRFDGDVGVAVEVFDRLGAKSGLLAPYRLRLVVDDSVVSDIVLERISFTHAGQVDFLYDISRVRIEKAFFFQLFEMTGEKMYNRHFLDGGVLGHAASGGGSDKDGERTEALRVARITATDFAGNESKLVFRYIEGSRGLSTGHSRPKAVAQVQQEWADLRGFFFRDGFVSVQNETAKLKSTSPKGKQQEPEVPGTGEAGLAGLRGVLTADDLLDGPVVVTLDQTGDEGAVHLVGITKDVLTSVNFPDLNLQLIVGDRSLYTDLVLYATSWSDEAESVNPGELRPRADPVRLGPYSATLRNNVDLRFLADRLDSTAAIYRLNERKGEWVFYESTVHRRLITTTAKRPGVYAVFADKFGPRIRRPFVRERKSYATGESRPEIVIPLEDSGSGVDDRRTSVYVAGIEQFAYWDSRSKKLLVVVRDQNIMGPQAISIVAYDKIGNRSQLDSTVDLPHSQQPQGNN